MLAFANGAILFAGAIRLEFPTLHAHRRFGHGNASQQTVPDVGDCFKARVASAGRFRYQRTSTNKASGNKALEQATLTQLGGAC
jgi:hypothetical protein